ncbi:hypothetical protein XELAEV_18038894mg [Xenopus laevis]|uniref:Uncharacterized protein n=1 Tax=Xenopus laevis TaxID=8355 RepID=A0A974C7N0_XENLA|nr:hypothetical protein XELAEV_18038894mg [Xenopus laevis]
MEYGKVKRKCKPEISLNLLVFMHWGNYSAEWIFRNAKCGISLRIYSNVQMGPITLNIFDKEKKNSKFNAISWGRLDGY